jgi:hypothetical protein
MPDMIERPHQPDLGLGISESDWASVEELLRQLKEEQARAATFEQIGFWLSAVSLVRRIEDRMAAAVKPTPRDSEYHRAILEILMGCGAVLSMALREIDDKHLRAVGLDPRNFDATVEELRIKHAAMHGDMTEARRAEILKEAFGVEEGTA